MGGAPALNPAQQVLSDQMISYWSRFVTTGAPDAPGQADWPQLNPEEPQWLSLQTGGLTVTTDFGARHQCGFWASLG
jgi:para-nitrobenzyl esterase